MCFPLHPAPAPVLLTLLTVLFTLTSPSVHAQPPTPTPSESTDFRPSDYKYLGIALGIVLLLAYALAESFRLLMVRAAGIVGLVLLCGCCISCSERAAPRRPPVRDVERGPTVTSSDYTEGQGAAELVSPPQACTKEDLLGVSAGNVWETSPPPYYPPPQFPPPESPALQKKPTMMST